MKSKAALVHAMGAAFACAFGNAASFQLRTNCCSTTYPKRLDRLSRPQIVVYPLAHFLPFPNRFYTPAQGPLKPYRDETNTEIEARRRCRL
jgi:hypothetical protein